VTTLRAAAATIPVLKRGDKLTDGDITLTVSRVLGKGDEMRYRLRGRYNVALADSYTAEALMLDGFSLITTTGGREQ